MSSEIVIPETPNWLQELEAKRERRLKAKLGHETGAGAPCLKCADKCPGLDLHFWRKNCKICRCQKEEHEVQDDDIYGWAQFQLLGSKPNKLKQKIVLPGKKDEIDLDWTPKGNKETVDKYLKTLAPDQLPVTGSQAARDRKQLLHKQIPIHDIDPNLCHELNEEELKKMNEYIAHVKENCVGVGQIVSLSNIIKGNLHMLSPADTEFIAKRYGKGVPLSEIVQLQSQRMAGRLQPKGLSQTMEGLSLSNKNLPNLTPEALNRTEVMANPVSSEEIHDKNYPLYSTEHKKASLSTQFSDGLRPRDKKHSSGSDQLQFDNDIDEKYKRNSNFDPKNRPSQFNPRSVPYQTNVKQNVSFGHGNNDSETENSAFVPYQKVSNLNYSVGNSSQQNALQNPLYANNLEGSRISSSNRDNVSTSSGNEKPKGGRELNPMYNEHGRRLSPIETKSQIETTRNPSYPYNNYFTESSNGSKAKSIDHLDTIPAEQYYHNQNNSKPSQLSARPNWGPMKFPSTGNTTGDERIYENVNDLRRKQTENLPSYIPGQYNVYSEHQTPTEIPRNCKDLAFSTYDTENDFRYGQYRQPGSYPAGNDFQSETGALLNARDLRPIQTADNQHVVNNFRPSSGSHNSNRSEAPNNANTEENPRYSQNQSDLPTDGELSRPKINKGGKSFGIEPVARGTNEDFLYPIQVNIGPIQDINYPEIKAATHGTNDFYEDYSPESIREILNNIKLPDCHYCKKPFEENEFAVAIDRAESLFHSECFKCVGCNQILADNFYFYHKESDNVYCLRDYAKIRGFPRCKACDELIFTKEYCLADNSTFHLKHFCCTECDKPLAGLDYTLDEEMPYCLPCYEQSKASKCSSCCQVIKPDEEGCTLNGIHFHPVDKCFACRVCKTPLMGKKLLLRNEKLYCSHECYQAFK